MEDHTVLWDVIWCPIISLPFLFNNPPLQALCLVSTIRQLSHAHKRLEYRLWKEIESPFLRHVAFPYALRILWCELLQRRFLIDIHMIVTNMTGRRSCIAGGFAAWRLERCLDTRHNGDGYPRATRQSFVSDGYARREVWVPSNVNVFVETGDEDDLVLEVIATRYILFCAQMFNDPRVMTLNFKHAHERNVVTALDLTQHLDEFEFGQDVRQLCRDQMFIDRLLEETSPTKLGNQSHTLSSAKHEPLVPTRLNVTFTEDSPQRRYIEWVLASFDLAHCKIACRVDDDTGAYVFYGSEDCAETLTQRRIQLSDGSLTHSRASQRETLERIRRYIERGFSVRGDRVFHLDVKKCMPFHKLCLDNVRQTRNDADV